PTFEQTQLSLIKSHPLPHNSFERVHPSNKSDYHGKIYVPIRQFSSFSSFFQKFQQSYNAKNQSTKFMIKLGLFFFVLSINGAIFVLWEENKKRITEQGEEDIDEEVS